MYFEFVFEAIINEISTMSFNLKYKFYVNCKLIIKISATSLNDTNEQRKYLILHPKIIGPKRVFEQKLSILLYYSKTL